MKPCGKRPPPIAGKHEHDSSVSYRGITRRISEEDRTPRWEYNTHRHNTFCQESSQQTDSIPIVSNVL